MLSPPTLPSICIISHSRRNRSEFQGSEYHSLFAVLLAAVRRSYPWWDNKVSPSLGRLGLSHLMLLLWGGCCRATPASVIATIWALSQHLTTWNVGVKDFAFAGIERRGSLKTPKPNLNVKCFWISGVKIRLTGCGFFVFFLHLSFDSAGAGLNW